MFGLYESWLSYMGDSWRLGLEAHTVINLRLAKLAQGDAAAAREASRMID